jgi:hypothetical protein
MHLHGGLTPERPGRRARPRRSRCLGRWAPRPLPWWPPWTTPMGRWTSGSAAALATRALLCLAACAPGRWVLGSSGFHLSGKWLCMQLHVYTAAALMGRGKHAGPAGVDALDGRQPIVCSGDLACSRTCAATQPR